MRSHVRVLLLLILIGAMGTLLLDAAARQRVEEGALERGAERLRAEANLLALTLAEDWPATPPLARAAAVSAAAALRVRVQLADPMGITLADSDSQVAGPPLDLSRRAEMIAAAASGFGRAAATEAGVGKERVARRVGAAGRPSGYVVLEAPWASLGTGAPGLHLPITLLGAGSMALLCLSSYLSIRRIVRPLRKVARAADRVASGQFDVQMMTGRDDEIGDLYASMDRMRRALIEQMGRSESERRLLASILGGIHEGILAVTLDRRVLMANDALRGTLGLSESPVPGAPFFQYVWDRAIVDAYDAAITRGEEERRRVTLPGGRAAELTVVPFADAAGRDAGAIGLFFDVTRLEALERVRRDFVADISHELRTPLASMRAAAETLGAGALSDPPEADRFLGILLKNAVRMEAILTDLTDLSLLETGGITLALGPVDLGAAVREAAAGLALRASARDVAIEVRIPDGLAVQADRRRLDQVLVNLLDNAIKFNRTGGSVHVDAEPASGQVRIRVEDTGQGVPPEALDRVFHRFYRVDRARSRDVAGTGMGLAIVKHLVLLHGGSVHAENREGGGARFVVTLQAARPA